MADTNTCLPDDLNVDHNGYPDEAVLDQIRAADTIDTGARWMVETFPKLAASLPYAVCDVTDVQNILGIPVKRIDFWTMGWSGCESFIDAVLGNTMLNMMYYFAWRRGGHHTFEVSETYLTAGNRQQTP